LKDVDENFCLIFNRRRRDGEWGKSVHPIYRQIIGGKKEEVVKLS
jgi:hypothetical protein